MTPGDCRALNRGDGLTVVTASLFVQILNHYIMPETSTQFCVNSISIKIETQKYAKFLLNISYADCILKWYSRYIGFNTLCYEGLFFPILFSFYSEQLESFQLRLKLTLHFYWKM